MNYQSFLSRAAATMQESAIRKMGMLGARVPDLISFAPGYPAPDSFPWDEFRAITSDLLTAREATTLQYGPTRGFRPLLESIVEVLDTRGIRATIDQLLVTTGSQQGLDLAARVLLDPGDVVLMELPSYTGAITAFRNVQAELVGVRQEADGIDLGHLDDVIATVRARGRRIRFLYVVPNFQNPTGLLIGREKRLRLLEAASRHDLLIVEDDPYGDLYFSDFAGPEDTRPIKADDREGRVVYLSSFSKTLAPGFRVAWMVAPDELAAKFEVAKQAEDLCSGALDQRVVWQAITRGVLAAQGPRLRALYQRKRAVMEHALRRELGDVVHWPEPRGGFFIWATLPEGLDADALLTCATRHRVIFVVGSAFFVDGTGRDLVRLSFSQPPPERIEEGIGRFADAVREQLGEQPQRRSGGGPGSAVTVPGSTSSGVDEGSHSGGAADETGTGGAVSGTVTPIGSTSGTMAGSSRRRSS
jgi:2-aminoadipate transaminase